MKAEEIAALLPAVFRNALPGDTTMAALLDAMEVLQDPVERRLASVDGVFDALTTSDPFAPMLARWVDLEWLYADEDQTDPFAAAQSWFESGLPIGRLRLLIEESHRFAQERGTARELVRFLEIATGVDGFSVDDAITGGAPFHLRVLVPPAAQNHMSLIERIVNTEKPAYATWEAVTQDSKGG